MEKLATEKTLASLLGMGLSIPVYQRPYKWTTENTEALLNDIKKSKEERNEVPYVMGTVIVSEKGENEYEIVDGQQRLTTLSILLNVLKYEGKNDLLSQEYKHVVSKKNIVENCRHIRNWLYRKNVDETDYSEWSGYLIEKLWFVLVIAPTMDDAFTFFDSQNSRGKKLEDSDLLKASHLRCIPKESDDATAVACSQHWERLDKKEILMYLLCNLWGRTRTLSRKERPPVDVKKEFKVLDSTYEARFQLNNYIQPPLFNSWEIDRTNNQISYKAKTALNPGENESLTVPVVDYKWLPLQITKTINSGEPFFLFTNKYYDLYNQLFQVKNDERLFRKLYDLLADINNTGVGFLLEAFEASMIFYFDKFGDDQLNEFAMWLEHVLFYKRLTMYSLYYSTVNNYLVDIVNPFEVIEDSSLPAHVIDQLRSISERLYLKDNVENFDLEKGIRRHFFWLMYSENGFYNQEEIKKYQKLFNAKNKLIKLN
ncbi:MAG: DUF262 domain-containing protein [Bacteroidetes bacterium]|nr:DUF262 domain-containing protein [Bacteroidota bacterium]